VPGDYEVEVPLREESVNPVGDETGENRMDQRMPPEPCHRLLSPFRRIVGGKAAGDGGANIDKSDQDKPSKGPPDFIWKGSLTRVALIKLRRAQLS